VVVGGGPDGLVAGFAGVEGEFVVAVQDTEVGVFDDDGDDFACVCPSDPESLSGNHGDAVCGDAALDLDCA
jgi:hypothetical protein